MCSTGLFRAEAERCAQDGLVTTPLRRNADGYAKMPFTTGWQRTTLASVAHQDWNAAEGIGLVLGSASGNRAVIDIDDADLAADAFALMLRSHRLPLMDYTARVRLHIHLIEPVASTSSALKVLYGGRVVNVELKASGTQVAIPPTPGYVWANPVWEPLYANLAEVWEYLTSSLGLERRPVHGRGPAGYPPPFQASVDKGERNNALFVEGCRLAEAAVPFDKALLFMERRVETSYEQGAFGLREVERTLRSAYKAVARGNR